MASTSFVGEIAYEPSRDLPERAWARALWLQHRSLRRIGEAIEAQICAAERPSRARAVALLAEFESALEDHFDAEERGGRLALAVAEAAHWAPRAAALTAEHEAFRADLADLVADARRAIGVDWESVCMRFRSLRRAIATHEQAENEILQRAYGEDLGVPG